MAQETKDGVDEKRRLCAEGTYYKSDIILNCARYLLYYGLLHLLDLDIDFDWGFLPFTWFDALILTADSSVYFDI